MSNPIELPRTGTLPARAYDWFLEHPGQHRARVVADDLGVTPFCLRNALVRLQDRGLLQVKVGAARKATWMLVPGVELAPGPTHRADTALECIVALLTEHRRGLTTTKLRECTGLHPETMHKTLKRGRIAGILANRQGENTNKPYTWLLASEMEAGPELEPEAPEVKEAPSERQAEERDAWPVRQICVKASEAKPLKVQPYFWPPTTVAGAWPCLA